jgi:hypothetical protein
MAGNIRGGHPDAYVRLVSEQLRPLVPSAPHDPGSLIFIDVEVDRDLSMDTFVWLQKLAMQAPAGFFIQASTVLLRWPRTVSDESSDPAMVAQADGVAEYLHDRGARQIDVGFVKFACGNEPRIVWGSSFGCDDEAERELLARARAVELWQLLEWGKGIWRPDGYHYSLPSGEHSNTFLRLANAIQRPRDARALASWLFRHIEEGLAVITDTPTMTPLVLALDEEMAAQGVRRGETVTLADYPANSFEAEQAIEGIKAAPKVLGLVSVSSTGSTVMRVQNALEHADTKHVIESIVSRTSPTERRLARPGRRMGPWLGVTHMSRSFPSTEQCEMCRDSADGRVVYIDPTNFETLGLSKPTLITPDFNFAHDNRELWEAYDDIERVGLNARPHESTLALRGNRDRLAIRCFPHDLLDPASYSAPEHYGKFLEAVKMRVQAAAKRIELSEPKGKRYTDPFRLQESDLIVTTTDDGGTEGFDAFRDAVATALGRQTWTNDQVLQVPLSDTRIDPARLKGVNTILILTLGGITGTSMQRLLVLVHDAIREIPMAGQPKVGGLVLHARPERDREWGVLHNAFTRLEALWMTPLPLSSPFQEELTLLGLVEPKVDASRLFLEHRRRFLSGLEPKWTDRLKTPGDADPYALFWGMPLAVNDDGTLPGRAGPRLRPGSRFGYRLRAPATFAAVGSAMQQRRQATEGKTTSTWVKFELPAILRSYFDPPIIASILRWLQPHEAWWGDRPEESANVIAEMLERATDDDLKILLPEFLWAAASGNVPVPGRDVLRAEARLAIDSFNEGRPLKGENPWLEAEVAPLVLGLELLEEDHDLKSLTEQLERRGEDLSRLVGQLRGIPLTSKEAPVDELRDLVNYLAKSITKLLHDDTGGG